MQTLTIRSEKQKQIIDITEAVREVVSKENLSDGLCSVTILHTTAAITTADLDPGTDQDFLDFLKAIIPQINFRHPHNPEHAPDHILTSIIGPSVTVPVQGGQLVLGTWQRIVLVEFDGPRERIVAITCIAT